MTISIVPYSSTVHQTNIHSSIEVLGVVVGCGQYGHRIRPHRVFHYSSTTFHTRHCCLFCVVLATSIVSTKWSDKRRTQSAVANYSKSSELLADQKWMSPLLLHAGVPSTLSNRWICSSMAEHFNYYQLIQRAVSLSDTISWDSVPIVDSIENIS